MLRASMLALVAVAAGWTAPPPGSSSRLLRANSPQMMPIGVPKVAYKVPGASSGDWVRSLPAVHVISGAEWATRSDARPASLGA